MFDSIKESMSQLRIRWRYRASYVLFVAGIIYSVLGVGLLIPSFLAPPVSLLILIPAIFLLCMGLGLWKYRTEATRIALLWWEVPAVILFVSGILLACLGYTINDELLIMVYLLVTLVTFAGPGIFVITHGRSLFGPTALRHKQLKELYQNAVMNRVAEPQIPTLDVMAEKDKQLLPGWIKFGGILFSIVFAVIEGLMLLDTHDRSVSGMVENYNHAADTSYPSGSYYEYSYTPSYSGSADHSYSTETSYETGYRYDSSGDSSSARATMRCNAVSDDNSKSGWDSSGDSTSARATVECNTVSDDNSKSGWEKTKEWCGEHKGELIAAGVAVAATAVAAMLSGDSSSADAGYSYKDSHSKIGRGLPFSQSQKAEILRQNIERNGGVLRSDLSGEILAAPQRCRKGVVPNPFEAQIDHIFPRSRGGANSAENAQVLSRRENIQKSNHVDDKEGFWSRLFK